MDEKRRFLHMRANFMVGQDWQGVLHPWCTINVESVGQSDKGWKIVHELILSIGLFR